VARPSPIDPTLSPLLLGAVAALTGLIVVRIRDAQRRGERLRPWRAAGLVTAVALTVVAFVSPLATLSASYLLTAHLVQITILMGFVPPLILTGLPRPDARRRLPRPLGAARDLAVHPAVAIVLVNVVLFGWHDPAIYDASLAHPELYAVQLLSLFAVSVAFWWSIVEPAGPDGPAHLTPLLKLGYILLATIPQTFAGLIFALAHRPFYEGYATAPQVLGMGHLVDQQIAGACMALVSKLALFAAFSVVLWHMLDPSILDDGASDDGGGGDGGSDRDGEPAPVKPPSPAWLGLLDHSPMPDEPAVPRRVREPAVGRR
jgi:putative membrane protein